MPGRESLRGRMLFSYISGIWLNEYSGELDL